MVHPPNGHLEDNVMTTDTTTPPEQKIDSDTPRISWRNCKAVIPLPEGFYQDHYDTLKATTSGHKVVLRQGKGGQPQLEISPFSKASVSSRAMVDAIAKAILVLIDKRDKIAPSPRSKPTFGLPRPRSIDSLSI